MGDNGPDRPGMRDNRDTVKRGRLQIIPECVDPAGQFAIGFPPGYASIKNIFHPQIYGLAADLIPALHLPVSEIELPKTRPCFPVRGLKAPGQLDTAFGGTGIDSVELSGNFIA